MIKPIGTNVLVKLEKKKSSIELLPGHERNQEDLRAIIEEVGTKCTLGLEKGHHVKIKQSSPMLIEETEEYDLLIFPEVSIVCVTNWTDKPSDDANAASGLES